MKNIFISVALVLCSFAAKADGNKFLSLKLNTMQGVAVEYGFDHFGIGLGQTSYSTTGNDGNGPYTFSMTVTTLRGAYYFDGFGQPGWYGVGLLGSVPIKVSQLWTSSGLTYTATAAGTYTGASGGYMWYWGGFNLGAGLGFFSISTPSTKIYDPSGTLINTLASATYSAGALDLTIGYTF